jgi:hypothetical protein
MRIPSYMRSIDDLVVDAILQRMTTTAVVIGVRPSRGTKTRNDSRGTVDVDRRKRKLVTKQRQSYRETTLPRSKLCVTVERGSDTLCSAGCRTV